MTERSCGTCSLCCKLLRVNELDKPQGRWCAHRARGKGCRVYADRPPSCRAFQCFWLMEEGFPDDLRPDRCHVMVTFTDDPEGVALHVDSRHPDAWQEGAAAAMIPALLKVYARLYVVCDDDRLVIRRNPDE